MEKIFNIRKDNSNFVITHNSGTLLEISGKNLFERGDPEFSIKDKLKESIKGGYKSDKKVVEFINAYYFSSSGKKITGFSLDDEICKQIDQLIRVGKLAWEANIKDREDNRIAPYLDFNEYVLYNIGCDTQQIHHDRADAIRHALKNGATQYPVFRGQRDSTNKYPGQYDDYIPCEYVRKIDGIDVARGYEYVVDEHYCIEKEAFIKSKNELDAIIEEKKQKSEAFIKSKFDEAKRTGEPVMISKISVPEEESPLHADGEGDIVDICKMAMPDGTIKEMCFHNY